jgi:hypothetical protein
MENTNAVWYTRSDAIIELDYAAGRLEHAKIMLQDLGCTFSIDQRIEKLIKEIDDLRCDLYSADLPGEK